MGCYIDVIPEFLLQFVNFDIRRLWFNKILFSLLIKKKKEKELPMHYSDFLNIFNSFWVTI